MPKEKIVRQRNWCYTKQGKVDIVFDGSVMSYQISEPEVAPTSGKDHFQGFLIFKDRKTLTQCKKIDAEAHWTACNGSIEENIKYCSKDGKASYAGSLDGCGQGSRTDLIEVGKALAKGSSIKHINEMYTSTFIKYSNGILKSKYYFDKSDAFRTVECFCYWGATGVGKTKKALEGGNCFMLSEPNNGVVWFDGYDGESTLVIDDFYGWIKQHTLLRICDGHPLHLAVKGAYTWAKWTKVIFTSNKEPNDWYKDGLSDAMKRRLPDCNIIELKIK